MKNLIEIGACYNSLLIDISEVMALELYGCRILIQFYNGKRLSAEYKVEQKAIDGYYKLMGILAKK